MKTGIIIIGGHVQALGIARILGELNIPVTILDSTSHNLARHSKYVKHFIKYKKGELLSKLLSLKKCQSYEGQIIFPTNDEHVGILSQNKNDLGSYFKIASASWEVVENCYNKRLTYKIAIEEGISIAETWMPNNKEELLKLQLPYPVIIKPAVMHSFYRKLKKKVFVCNNAVELLDNYKLAIAVIPAEEIIIQDIIPGGSEHLYSACFLFDGQKEIQSFVGRRCRQHPPDFGKATTFAQIVDNEELLETSRKLLRAINYQGVCEVEYKFDPTNQAYKFLEINPRTWKWHSIAAKGGSNMLENYFLMLQNQELKPVSPIKKASFRHLMTDIPTVFNYKLKGLYKKQPKFPMQYAVWTKKDLLPAIFELLYFPYFLLKR
jgi:D-aspartate ligase